MKKIEVKVLNPQAAEFAEKIMVCAARLTQRGHRLHSMADLTELFEKPYTPETVERMAALPHPTIQKLAAIDVAVVGSSRRFLAQITRHQNEVKFMSASLQYSDYSGQADFAVPYEVLVQGKEEEFLAICRRDMAEYDRAVKAGLDHDAAGYMTPQALRNILLISATPYQWKHMISQRVCRRNTSESRIVLLKIWRELYALNPRLFAPETTGPFCVKDGACREGAMCCGRPTGCKPPEELLREDYPLLFAEQEA